MAFCFAFFLSGLLFLFVPMDIVCVHLNVPTWARGAYVHLNPDYTYTRTKYGARRCPPLRFEGDGEDRWRSTAGAAPRRGSPFSLSSYHCWRAFFCLPPSSPPCRCPEACPWGITIKPHPRLWKCLFRSINNLSPFCIPVPLPFSCSLLLRV